MLHELTADIVTSYVASNKTRDDELLTMIATVYQALARAHQGVSVEPEPEDLTPAVPIKHSVRPDRVYCLECGASFQALKRHLGTAHNLTPDAYRQRWNLSRDYPITAPAYSQARSQIAKSAGLGLHGRARKKRAAKKR